MQKRQERLQKIISAHGAASRRKAEQMIIDGRVCVNGTPATIGQSAEFGLDLITIDGKPLCAEDEHVYLMLNKPRGYITTISDDRGRKTVMSLVADVGKRIYPVGRLDMNSEGLLLFTNDGAFSNRITHPSYQKKKTYEVEVYGDVRNAVSSLQQPIEIDNRLIQAVSVELAKVTSSGGEIRITIVEGRNRQVRKMCAVCGVKVRSLRRISVGELELGDLKIGKWRYLRDEELKAIL